MRINKYLANATSLSRRGADEAILAGRVMLDGRVAKQGEQVSETSIVLLDGSRVEPVTETVTLMFHKPVGYVVSRYGQGSDTIYDLLPPGYHHLNPIGRLDKQSSGLLLLTNDGILAENLTHPRYEKNKLYEITLDKPLQPLHRQLIEDHGITLTDGISKLHLERQRDGDDRAWLVTMHEGRNRQIRRTFEALGYRVTRLHRIAFGSYKLTTLKSGEIRILP